MAMSREERGALPGGTYAVRKGPPLLSYFVNVSGTSSCGHKSM